MTDQNYLTIGELARRVGVTVRTIQYYDQQGLLSPSAKGPQNQRLYTDDNVKDLYRILTLKYLGLSLAQIKSDAALYREPAALQELADEQMDAIEEQFQSLFKRMTTLRSLHDESLDDASVNWEAMADTIERCQGESQFFWRLTCIRDDAPASEEAAENQVARGESVSKWHELIADTIRLMPAGEPVDSERNRELAKRYLELDMEQDTARAEQNFILMENIAPHAGGDGSFDELRQAVFDHLEAIVASYRSRRRAGAAKPHLSYLPLRLPHGTSYPRSVSASMAPPKGEAATKKGYAYARVVDDDEQVQPQVRPLLPGRRGGH